MARLTLNLGILAHVDAGKTTLTERILYETGTIPAVGRVDKGTTQTDSLELERARGITIKAAVVSFAIGGLTVNLIDTPGHADFVAEVERSLGVLDGVVLVVSAVEGVQSQTRRLARAIRGAGLPMLIFVNKIDRLGARDEAVLDEIGRKLGGRPLAMNWPRGLGGRAATVVPCGRGDPAWKAAAIDILADADEGVIAAFDRAGGDLADGFVADEVRSKVAAGEVVPVFFGSAIGGASVAELLAGIAAWLPPAAGGEDLRLDAAVFKIGRRPSGEKLVYARLFAGTLAVRQRVAIRRPGATGPGEPIEERVTGIDRPGAGHAPAVNSVSAGEIVVLHGLRAARIGDRLGERLDAAPASCSALERAFPPPSLESVVHPVEPGETARLRAALEELAEQDPLISLRQRNDEGEISVRLYGEVQKEVIAATLALEYGLAVAFGPSLTACVERPIGVGRHAEFMGGAGNPFDATIGFRVEPGEPGTGVAYRRDLGSLPLAFYRAVEETLHEALGQGLRGWPVVDCVVTLIEAGFSSPTSTAADFRRLTPLVLLYALAAAGTTVCEPIEAIELEIPADAYGAVSGALIAARATIRDTVREGSSHRIVGAIPTAELRGLEERLPGLTRNEAGWTTGFAGYVPVSGEPPVRARVGPNPLNRAHYLAEVARG